jgi:hypothetical protein
VNTAAKKTDYISQGKGKFVLICLPNAPSWPQRRDNVERTWRLKAILQGILALPVNHTAGEVSFLEFFWDEKLDENKVDKVLTEFMKTNSDLTIKFQEKSSLPLKGIK